MTTCVPEPPRSSSSIRMIRGRGGDERVNASDELIDSCTSLPLRPRPMHKPVVAISALILLAACTSTEGGPRPASGPSGGTFIYSAPSDPQSVFPAFVAEQVGAVVIDLVFDHLADI